MILSKRHFANEENKMRGLRLLIAAGADITLEDNAYKTFLD